MFRLQTASHSDCLSLVSQVHSGVAVDVDEHVQTAPLGNDLFVQFLNGLVVAQVDGLGHDLVVGVDLLERC